MGKKDRALRLLAASFALVVLVAAMFNASVTTGCTSATKAERTSDALEASPAAASTADNTAAPAAPEPAAQAPTADGNPPSTAAPFMGASKAAPAILPPGPDQDAEPLKEAPFMGASKAAPVVLPPPNPAPNSQKPAPPNLQQKK